MRLRPEAIAHNANYFHTKYDFSNGTVLMHTKRCGPTRVNIETNELMNHDKQNNSVTEFKQKQTSEINVMKYGYLFPMKTRRAQSKEEICRST